MLCMYLPLISCSPYFLISLLTSIALLLRLGVFFWQPGRMQSLCDTFCKPRILTRKYGAFCSNKSKSWIRCQLQHHKGFLQSARTFNFTTNIVYSEEKCEEDLKRMSPILSGTALQAVLFDVDGTLCDSDPLHYLTFRDMLQEVGFQGGVPITEEFYSKNISGKHNDDIGATLFPEWDENKCKKFLDDKEALFRSIAAQHLKPINGLHKLCKWIERCGIRRAAVTNAPRENADLMISIVGLTDFFELVVIGSECEQAKPFPDPYLKALQHFKIQANRAFAIEDSTSGLKAAVGAGLAVLGVTTRNPGQELLEAGATFLIKDFEDPNLWNALES